MPRWLEKEAVSEAKEELWVERKATEIRGHERPHCGASHPPSAPWSPLGARGHVVRKAPKSSDGVSAAWAGPHSGALKGWSGT